MNKKQWLKFKETLKEVSDKELITKLLNVETFEDAVYLGFSDYVSTDDHNTVIALIGEMKRRYKEKSDV